MPQPHQMLNPHNTKLTSVTSTTMARQLGGSQKRQQRRTNDPITRDHSLCTYTGPTTLRAACYAWQVQWECSLTLVSNNERDHGNITWRIHPVTSTVVLIILDNLPPACSPYPTSLHPQKKVQPRPWWFCHLVHMILYNMGEESSTFFTMLLSQYRTMGPAGVG